MYTIEPKNQAVKSEVSNPTSPELRAENSFKYMPTARSRVYLRWTKVDDRLGSDWLAE
ncbi:hypothetical protein Pse7367_3861 (plasmid) [Thalassoporum mexicanum PCC 7367]|uniref:hypothetical protein n=1 Tax=Thalassoporum mexicanum TaxID=3457544 RepID=UPI00029FB02D|nr:hypothetical protein [Pseudanabaena sp. PCC 7367]AFY72084.1 hypothetical protein Pse7367_3861 [Pseudanabaena sp. PCC 7367]